MKKLLLLGLAWGLVMSASAQYNRDNLRIGLQSQAPLLIYGNLKIYPILANQKFLQSHARVGNYTTLEEALAQKKVRIVERGMGEQEGNEPSIQTNGNGEQRANRNDMVQEQVQNNLGQFGGGDQVNSLFLENTSNDTLFLLAGEIVKGGKQDRVLAQDLKLAPNSGQVDISVFCVEHGRWSYGAKPDGFDGYGSVSTMDVRKAAVKDKNQSQVWAKVAEVTAKNSAESETGTYNALEKSGEFQEKLQSYVAHFTGLPYQDVPVIGMVGVTGDRVIACDLFATPDLFRAHFPNLIRGYATEAISNGAPVLIKEKEVDDYLAKILDESRQRDYVNENGLLYEEKNVKLHINTYGP